jgi:MFS transporter, TsgA protein
MNNNFNNETVNQNKILLLSYITAFFAGYAFPLAGILSPQVAVDLGVKTTQVVFVDSFFLVGLTIGSLISCKFLEKLGTVRSIITSVSILLLVNIGFAVQYSLYIYSLFVLINGTSMGLLIASVNYFIISAFIENGNLSDSKLNIMQFFVGIGAFIGTLSAGFIVFYSSWRIVFIVASFFYLAVIVTFKSVKTQYIQTNITHEDKTRENKKKVKVVPIYVLMVGLAMIAYVYVEYIISYWFSPYLQEVRNYNIKSVGGFISIFWLIIAFGRLFFGKYVLLKVSDYSLIITLSFITVLGFLCFMYSSNSVMIYLSIILLGIGCSAIFPTLLAYGMKLSEKLSTYTLSFLVTCGFFGGVLSLICSSVIGTHLPKSIPILTGPVWCLLIIIFLMAAKKLKASSSH